MPLEKEILSETDRYNEHIMTRLRTKWGVSLKDIEGIFGIKYRDHLLSNVKQHLDRENLILADDCLRISRKGKFLTDGIASDLFLVNLD